MQINLFKNYLAVLPLSVFCAVLLFGVSKKVVGQETEAASSLKLTGTSLPANARRVLREHIPAEIERTLENFSAASNGKLRRGDTEVLIWTGVNPEKSGSNSIIGRLSGSLKAAGWRYEINGTENGVTLFSLLKHGTMPRAIVGFYGEADGTLLYALTELHVGDGNRTNSNPASYGDRGNIGDYGFMTPSGWSRLDSAGQIVLSKGNEHRIEFLPPMDSSGNLERDAEKIIWQVFKGFDAWYSNGFEADWGTFEKGRTMQGLEYFRVYRYAKRIGDENNGFAQSKFDAIILLVKLGGKVAVIAGRQPFQTDFARDSTLAAIDLILYDLKFKSVSDSGNLKNDLLGSWSSNGGGASLAYTFNANGTFHKGAATEFRTSRDERTDNVTTTSYGMTQSYSLSGNILTQNYKRTGETLKYKIRIYYTKYDKDAWQYKLGFLPLGSYVNNETIVLRRHD